MSEATTSFDAQLACPVTGEECPERRKIVEAYDIDDSTRIAIEAIMDVDDLNHPRYDQRKKHANLALHAWQVDQGGCLGVRNQECGIITPENSKVNWLGKIASKFTRK